MVTYYLATNDNRMFSSDLAVFWYKGCSFKLSLGNCWKLLTAAFKINYKLPLLSANHDIKKDNADYDLFIARYLHDNKIKTMSSDTFAKSTNIRYLYVLYSH